MSDVPVSGRARLPRHPWWRKDTAQTDNVQEWDKSCGPPRSTTADRLVATADRTEHEHACHHDRQHVRQENHVVFADPDGRELQAAALEQLGHQSESGP
jgi:hypothetical protein